MRSSALVIVSSSLLVSFLTGCKTGGSAAAGQEPPPGNAYGNPPGYSGRQGGYPAESDYVQVAPVGEADGGGNYQAPSYPEGGSSGGSYTVQKGDTLYGISRRNSTTVAKLKAANNLTGDTIRPGQVLQLP